MVINALNSGAKVFMADFEDANTPTWENLMEGQINLRDAIRRTIEIQKSGGEGIPAEGASGCAVRSTAWMAASTTMTARNQAFNVVDGDLFRWKWLWPKITQ
jgi:hypothetical protein